MSPGQIWKVKEGSEKEMVFRLQAENSLEKNER